MRIVNNSDPFVFLDNRIFSYIGSRGIKTKLWFLKDTKLNYVHGIYYFQLVRVVFISIIHSHLKPYFSRCFITASLLAHQEDNTFCLLLCYTSCYRELRRIHLQETVAIFLVFHRQHLSNYGHQETLAS
jgi:hypothetical protein